MLNPQKNILKTKSFEGLLTCVEVQSPPSHHGSTNSLFRNFLEKNIKSHWFIEERALWGHSAPSLFQKKGEKKTLEKVLWNWWNNLLNKPPVGNTHSHWGQHAVQHINKNTFGLRQCWGQTYPRWTREAQIPSEMKI